MFVEGIRSMSVERRRVMIEPAHPHLSLVRQCALVLIGRSTFYRTPTPDTSENLARMRLLDEQFLETPWYGSRQMVRHLRRLGHAVGRKRVRRRMGLVPIYQRPRTPVPHPEHRIYPYLLRNVVVDRPNQVWCADITYIPMRRGFLYRVAVVDWGHRQANAALYRVVIVRMRSHQPTLDYVRRRTAEGKSKPEIIRCLKRFVVREIFGNLCRGTRAAPPGHMAA